MLPAAQTVGANYSIKEWQCPDTVIGSFQYPAFTVAYEGTMGGAAPSGHGELNSGPMPLDVDISRLSLDPTSADTISQHLGSLAALQQGDRLQRLERSLLRLEHINLDTLETLRKLVKAVRKAQPDEPT